MMRWSGDGGRNLRVLVGDQQPMVAAALGALLTQNGFHVVASASSGADAAAAIGTGGIDIAILDIDMIGPSTVAIVADIRQRGDRTMMIVTSPADSHPAIPTIMACHADGLVLKSEPVDTLRHCLDVVVSGGRWIDPNALAHAANRDPTRIGSVQLTPRERDVARLVAAGHRNRAIGDALGISDGTVKMHLHNVYNKLGVESRTQLALDGRIRAIA